ncbi:MAG: nitroreductase family protein [Candidatus Bipolaricaulota bacterium]
MNTLLQEIQRRRTVRAFRSEPVEEEKIEALVEAGRWAPSGKNTQPWRFVVVRSQEKRRELGELVPQRNMIATAPVTIAVLKHVPSGYDELKDAHGIGACAQNLLLAAHALGLGCCWIGRARDPEVEALVEAQEDEELMLLLPVGYPAEEPGAGRRKPLEELVRYI